MVNSYLTGSIVIKTSNMATAEAVKVAVRVRPFNDRERERKAKLIMKMDGNTTYISDPNEPDAEPRKFTFDYSYWSHDGFDTGPDGVLTPTSGSQYADQQRVFNDLGRGVLSNAFAGAFVRFVGFWLCISMLFSPLLARCTELEGHVICSMRV